MNTILAEAFLPAARRHRERCLANDKTAGKAKRQGPMHASVAAAAAPLPKIGISFDGESSFLQAAMGLLTGAETKDAVLADFVLFKWPASCSKTQQPLDISPCFMSFKQKMDQYMAAGTLPPYLPYMAGVESLLACVPSDSRTVFLRVISLLERAISAAFTIGNIAKGWEISGLVEPNVQKIMTMNLLGSTISDELMAAFNAAAVKLAPRMLANGDLTDEEMQEAMGTAIEFPKANLLNDKGRKTRKATHEKVIAHRRAVIVSSPRILQQYAGQPVQEEHAVEAEKVSAPL